MSGYLQHVTGPSTRWDHLAYLYYGDAKRISPIITANRSLFIDTLGPIPDLLPVGLTLKIPVVDPDPADPNLLPPWKRGATS